CLQYHSHPWTF
nr:immunoglobulin light chain junction region [Macaca mulatta]